MLQENIMAQAGFSQPPVLLPVGLWWQVSFPVIFLQQSILAAAGDTFTIPEREERITMQPISNTAKNFIIQITGLNYKYFNITIISGYVIIANSATL